MMIGENLLTGALYGYSSVDRAYGEYEPKDKNWYSVPEEDFNASIRSDYFSDDKFINPDCQAMDSRRLYNRFPLSHATYVVATGLTLACKNIFPKIA